MRVGVNAYFLNHPYTGSGQYLANLMLHLPEVTPGWEWVWYAPDGTPLPSPGPTGRLFHLSSGSARRSHWSKLYFEQYAFPRAARKHGCDVLWVPYFGPPSAEGSRTVVTVHDVVPLVLPRYRGGILPRAYSALVRSNVGRCRLLLADSEWTLREAVQALGLPASRFQVVPLGVAEHLQPVHDETTRAVIRRRYGLLERYVLYMGGYDPRKRVDLLIAGHRLLTEREPSTPPLVLAGQLPRRRSRTLAALQDWLSSTSMSGKLLPIGNVAEDDKAVVLSMAELFAFPSEYEGFGLPPLEAMACGTAVAVANASSVPEVVGDAAWLVTDPTPEAWAQALDYLLKRPALRCKLGSLGRTRASQFTWERTARLTAEAIASIA